MNTAEDLARADLFKMARLVVQMFKAQRAYFDAKKLQPHVKPEAELRESLAIEKRLAAFAADVLARERQTLPGMGAEGGETAAR